MPLNVVARAKLFPTIAHNPKQFVVVDYDTLFAALNADQPGVLTPNEAWSFTPAHPPRGALTIAHAESRLRNDPLAAGTRDVLALTGALAAALALMGLVLSARSTLAAERLALAEYEALGVAPRLLRRSTQLRLLVLSAVGVAAGLGGAVLATRVIGALVAVTGTARRPLPPIASVVAWSAGAVVLAALVVAALATTAVAAGRALREPVAKRLRA